MKRTVSFIAAVCILFSYLISGASAYSVGPNTDLDSLVSSIPDPDCRAEVENFLTEQIVDLGRNYVFYSSGVRWQNRVRYFAFIVSDKPFYFLDFPFVFAESGASINFIIFDAYSYSPRISYFTELSSEQFGYHAYNTSLTDLWSLIQFNDNDFIWNYSYDLLSSDGEVFAEANLDLGSYGSVEDLVVVGTDQLNGQYIVYFGIPKEFYSLDWQLYLFTSAGEFLFSPGSSFLLFQFETEEYYYLEFNAALSSKEVRLYAWDYYDHGDLLFTAPQDWLGLTIYPGINGSITPELPEVPPFDHEFSPVVTPSISPDLTARVTLWVKENGGFSFSNFPSRDVNLNLVFASSSSLINKISAADIICYPIGLDTARILAKNSNISFYLNDSLLDLINYSGSDWLSFPITSNIVSVNSSSFASGPFDYYENVVFYYTDSYRHKLSLSQMGSSNNSLVNIENALCSADGSFAKFWFWLASYFSGLNLRLESMLSGIYDISWNLSQIRLLLSQDNSSDGSGEASFWFLEILDRVKEYDLSVDAMKIKNYFYYTDALPWILDPDADGDFIDDIFVPLALPGGF